METIYQLPLRSAHLVELPYGHGRMAVKLSIGNKTAYIYEPNMYEIKAGFVELQDLDCIDDQNWCHHILPVVRLTPDYAEKMHMSCLEQRSCTNDPRIVKLALELWAMPGKSAGYFAGKKLFPNAEATNLEVFLKSFADERREAGFNPDLVEIRKFSLEPDTTEQKKLTSPSRCDVA
ncbi:MAG: hypothetical protein LBJ94_02755 [Puniceicoccales bacterium]|jgi:hypothetical protein|nr:hypothetical protein [Puniceicoccales bacterium]